MVPIESFFVDSVFFIALNSTRDNWKDAAQAAADDLHPQQHLVTSHGVLSETLAHFSRATSEVRSRLGTQFRNLGHDSQFTIVTHDLPLMEHALDVYSHEFANSTLSLQDCVSIVIMREYGITSILTADQEFTRAGFTPLLRRYLS